MMDRVSVTLAAPAKVDGEWRRAGVSLTVSRKIAEQLGDAVEPGSIVAVEADAFVVTQGAVKVGDLLTRGDLDTSDSGTRFTTLEAEVAALKTMVTTLADELRDIRVSLPEKTPGLLQEQIGRVTGDLLPGSLPEAAPEPVGQAAPATPKKAPGKKKTSDPE